MDVTTRRNMDNSVQQTSRLKSKKIVLVLVALTVVRLAIFGDVQKVWRGIGKFWEERWNTLLDKVGDEPIVLWGYGIYFVVIIAYIIDAATFTILDFIPVPEFLRRYKIQQHTEPVELKRFLKVMVNVLINLFIVNVFLMYPQTWLMEWRGHPPAREVPSFQQLFGQIVVLLVILEIFYYYGHRALHHRLFYKHIHKQHHEWTSPIAVTAGYAHPVEFICHNMLPIYAGIFIVGTHAFTAWLWYTITVLGMVSTHCGYHFPFTPSGEFHDFHHNKFTENFGIMGWLDHIHKTSTKFKKTTQYQRDAIQFHFMPTKVLYPDPVQLTKITE